MPRNARERIDRLSSSESDSQGGSELLKVWVEGRGEHAVSRTGLHHQDGPSWERVEAVY